MKKQNILLVIMMLTVLIAACNSNGTDSTSAGEAAEAEAQTLLVADTAFSIEDLDAMPHTEAVFNDVTYVGVSVTELLSSACSDLASLSAVKAVASDGYSINYSVDQLTPENVIVAYAAMNDSMVEEDGAFRMVLPDAEGKMNLRMLVELQVVQ